MNCQTSPKMLASEEKATASISGLKETFIKRYVVERTNQAEVRPEKQSEKTESCRENLSNEMQLKGP